MSNEIVGQRGIISSADAFPKVTSVVETAPMSGTENNDVITTRARSVDIGDIANRKFGEVTIVPGVIFDAGQDRRPSEAYVSDMNV